MWRAASLSARLALGAAALGSCARATPPASPGAPAAEPPAPNEPAPPARDDAAIVAGAPSEEEQLCNRVWWQISTHQSPGIFGAWAVGCPDELVRKRQRVGEEAFARYAACVLASVNYDGDRRCEVTSELAPYLCRQRTHFKRRALQDNGEALPAPAFFAAEEECLSLAEPTRVELGDEAYRALVECTAAATDLAEGEACLLRACPSDRRPRDDETPTLCTPGS